MNERTRRLLEDANILRSAAIKHERQDLHDAADDCMEALLKGAALEEGREP